MRTTSVQFHATPEEVTEFIHRETAGESIFLSFRPSFPGRFSLVSREELQENLAGGEMAGGGGEMAITLSKPELGEFAQKDFFGVNKNCILVEIGRLSENGLKQSAISTMTNDEFTYDFAKKIIRRLKSITKAGVATVNTESGARAVSRTFRYTVGAEKLQNEQILMLAYAGGNKHVLGTA